MTQPLPTEALVFAFCHHLAARIVDADGAVSAREVRFLRHHFPEEAFLTHGFVGADGALTDRWHDALDAALLELPTRLSAEERLDLIALLFEAASADDHVHAQEQVAVDHAARLLGLAPEQVSARLRGPR